MHRSLAWTRCAFAPLALLACGAPQSPAPPPTPAPSASAVIPDPLPSLPADAGVTDADRHQLFTDAVALARRFHVFSAQTAKNLGHSWDDELPRLEAEFAAAKDRAGLVLALIHFGNSLHNQHCGFDPKDDATVVVLDAAVDVEWTDGKPVFYVVTPAKGTAMVAGDILADVDGVPASALLEHDVYRSNANNWFGISRAVARSLTRRSTRTTQEGAHATWTLQPRGGGVPKKVELAWHAAPDTWTGTDYAIDYAHAPCADLPAVDYGPYALTSEGPNVCLYTSTDRRYAPYPIVRYFSFGYVYPHDKSYGPAQHRARADHDALLAGLSSVKGARAVLVDLRDNHGGNNPNWVMDWFAPQPYVDHYVFTRLDEALRDPALRKDANMDDAAEARAYLAELDARTPEQRFTRRRPFFCRPDTCDWDNRYAPSHRVTSLPLALLVGPNCVSSCDSLTQQFAEQRLAPLIGEPTAMAHTTRRMKREIVFHGEVLGTLEVAFSYEVSGVSGEPVEGVPIHLDDRVDRTFANRDRYDALLVDRAIAVLGKRRAGKP